MLLQRRSRSKDVCPGMWDLSVAEHLQPGEGFIDAAHRGLEEELSLRSLELIPLAQELKQRLEIAEQGVLDLEVQRLFVCVSDANPVVSDQEVAEVRYATLEEIAEVRKRSPEELTPWFRSWLDAINGRKLLPEGLLEQSQISPVSPDS